MHSVRCKYLIEIVKLAIVSHLFWALLKRTLSESFMPYRNVLRLKLFLEIKAALKNKSLI